MMRSIIVLAFNDARSLPALVAELDRVLSESASPYEIIVVDDGSRDDTASTVNDLARRFPSIRLVQHGRNRGVGAAFRSGWEASRGEWVGYLDGDGQYDPADLRLLSAKLEDEQVGAASGRRRYRADPRHRRLISFIYNQILRNLFGLRLKDANSGIKLYRRGFLEAGGPQLSDGAFFDAEILLKGRRAGYRVAETPVSHRPRRHGIAGGISRRSIQSTFSSLTDERFRYLRQKGLAAKMSLFLVKLLSRVMAPGHRSS